MKKSLTIGERIRERRKELGLTQGQLAKLAGYVSKATINKYEIGKHTPSITTLKKLAKALKCSPEYLLSLRTKEEMEVVELLGKLSKEQLKAVKAFIACLDKK